MGLGNIRWDHVMGLGNIRWDHVMGLGNICDGAGQHL